MPGVKQVSGAIGKLIQELGSDRRLPVPTTWRSRFRAAGNSILTSRNGGRRPPPLLAELPARHQAATRAEGRNVRFGGPPGEATPLPGRGREPKRAYRSFLSSRSSAFSSSTSDFTWSSCSTRSRRASFSARRAFAAARATPARSFGAICLASGPNP